jgi:hypothetical protein
MLFTSSRRLGYWSKGPQSQTQVFPNKHTFRHLPCKTAPNICWPQLGHPEGDPRPHRPSQLSPPTAADICLQTCPCCPKKTRCVPLPPLSCLDSLQSWTPHTCFSLTPLQPQSPFFPSGPSAATVWKLLRYSEHVCPHLQISPARHFLGEVHRGHLS